MYNDEEGCEFKMKENCLFCKIATNQENALILYEDDILMVILDAYPNSDGHALVIPKKHYETIYDMDEETFLHIYQIGKKYGNIIMKKLNKKAMTFTINYGESQVIKHFHLHLIPNAFEKPATKREEIYEILMRENND